jgi:hypothetical protein
VERALRFRGRLHLGPAPDPDRRRRDLPPTASLEEHIEDFVGWMIAGGFSPEEATRRGEWIREFHRKTGLNFLTLPPGEQLAFIIECDRQLDELERQEAEDLADVDLGEPEH